MISFARKLVFFAVPKCGSTSLEEALTPHMPTRLAGPPAVKHAGLRDFNRYLRPLLAEKGFTDFATVAAVREPIDWLMSWWRYRSRPEHRGHARYTGDMNFAEFAEAYLSAQPPPYAQLAQRHPHELLRDGESAVEHLFRYENLDGMVRWLSNRLGTALHVPRRNVSPAPRVEVPPELAERLRAALADDYELWACAR